MSDLDPLLEGDVPGRSAARTVRLPALFLLTLGTLGALFALGGLLLPSPAWAPGRGLSSAAWEWFDALSGAGRILLFGALLLLNGGIVLGALAMRNLSSRGLALTACLLSCLNAGCCCVTAPFGIWGLMVLNEEHVKTAFDRVATPDFRP